MNQANIIFGLINISSGFLFIAISIPLVKRKIRMNRLYGFRISKAFKSDENWYKINTYGGKQYIIWSFPLIMVGFLCFLFPIEEQKKDMMAIIQGVLPITIFTSMAILKTLLYARSL